MDEFELNESHEPEIPAVEIRFGQKQVDEALSTLNKYKAAKGALEQRIIEDEQWYTIRHWDVLRKKMKPDDTPQPSSAWLFNAIMNKHADAMDNYPESVVLPREQSDEQSAKVLSEVLPVVIENNDFEETYSDAWWDKLKHGTAVYGVFWSPEKENGLGDIDVKAIDLLKIFWEGGITDIQKSRNLFIVDLIDTDILESQYPEKKGKLSGSAVDVKEYVHDSSIDTSDKSVVIDMYYKKRNDQGKTILHFAKMVGNELLYASENDPMYAETGWYEHGQYPVVFDVMYPEKSTPCGFGLVSICKDPQTYIDKILANVMETSVMNSKKRFFVSNTTDIDVKEFADTSNALVHVNGELSDLRLQEIKASPLDPIYLNVIQHRIEEMKDTASNRDVNSGGSAGAGVTAAAAIAALQEAGNKNSRDLISASYRSVREVYSLCIELMRQFYDEARSFRITAPDNTYQFVEMSNAMLGDQAIGMSADGSPLYRKPVFDLKVQAQKQNPFSRMEQNERAKELYSMGFFSPEKAQESMIALDMMTFEGKDKILEKVMQGQTLLNIVQQQQQQIQQLVGLTYGMAGIPADGSQGKPQTAGKAPESADEETTASGLLEARKPMTSYGQALAKRSTPSV